MIRVPRIKLPWWKRSSRGSGEVVDVGCGWRSFSYDRFAQPLMQLSVARLDGSSFDVFVARTASVGDLKKAVEEMFSGVEVSWSVVWGHFTLSCKNYKLKDKKTKLKVLGIKDGDQLEFIRNSDLRSRSREDDK